MIKLGDIETPKVIREGNLSMFKSIIISNNLLRGFLIIFILISLIAVLTLVFKNIKINSIVKVISIIGSVFIIFIGFYHFKNTPYTENDVYDTIESKAENFITDFTNKEYDKMITNYVLNNNMNEFASKSLYSQAMNRTIREYGQIREIEDPIKIYFNYGYTVLSYPVTYGNDQVVYYNITFNSKNEISSLFTTRSLLD
ncbi:MAG: hypothetical protein PHY13_10450 [Clostridia bacterium]|nr:hypothetical protein [Clostridia bacterium]